MTAIIGSPLDERRRLCIDQSCVEKLSKEFP